MNVNTIRRYLIPVLVLVFGLLLLSSTNLRKGKTSLADRFPNGYNSKTLKVNDKYITFTQDVRLASDSPPERTPIIYDEANKDNYYVINFTGDNGDCCIDNSAYYIRDLNKDSNNELVTEWTINWGGSGGHKGMIIWSVGDKLVPYTGFPTDTEIKILVKDKNNQVIKSFPITDMHTYSSTGYNNGKLYLAKPAYDSDVHLGLQSWYLSVYQFNNGQFVIDKTWNKGDTYLSSEKFEIGGIAFSQFSPIFDRLSK